MQCCRRCFRTPLRLARGRRWIATQLGMPRQCRHLAAPGLFNWVQAPCRLTTLWVSAAGGASAFPGQIKPTAHVPPERGRHPGAINQSGSHERPLRQLRGRWHLPEQSHRRSCGRHATASRLQCMSPRAAAGGVSICCHGPCWRRRTAALLLLYASRCSGSRPRVSAIAQLRHCTDAARMRRHMRAESAQRVRVCPE